ncbi:hypothetical protein CLV53_101332 [Sediminibacterium magnilacihabitans]|jgi:hypothetical protein|nr:hypothetical protein CLV53_101332 [Sediminibacterium magnilacihabitans]
MSAYFCLEERKHGHEVIKLIKSLLILLTNAPSCPAIFKHHHSNAGQLSA